MVGVATGLAKVGQGGGHDLMAVSGIDAWGHVQWHVVGDMGVGGWLVHLFGQGGGCELQVGGSR